MMNIQTPLNYTGSKFKLLDQILPLMDYSKNIFIDLFVGGGSVYANVVDKYNKILINDKIKNLILIHYLMINNSVSFKEEVTFNCRRITDKESYMKFREKYNNNPSPGRLMALMLSCTNNMLRFNKKFKFNQTYGKRSWNDRTEKKYQIFTDYMKNYADRVIYKSCEFYDVPIITDSMVYIDPPYINTEAGYNSYWSKEHEKKLYEYITELNKNSVSFMLSGLLTHNGVESELIQKLIDDGFNLTELECDYNKVSRNKKDKQSKEIVIRNYND